jgi:hypothetical protein
LRCLAGKVNEQVAASWMTDVLSPAPVQDDEKEGTSLIIREKRARK